MSLHGKDTVVLLDGDNISAICNSVEFNKTVDSHDNTTFVNNGAKSYQAGLTDGTVTLSGLTGGAAETGSAFNLVEPHTEPGAANVTLIYRPEGTGSSKAQKSVTVQVTSFNVSAEVAGLVEWQAECQMSSPVTDSTQ